MCMALNGLKNIIIKNLNVLYLRGTIKRMSTRTY